MCGEWLSKFFLYKGEGVHKLIFVTLVGTENALLSIKLQLLKQIYSSYCNKYKHQIIIIHPFLQKKFPLKKQCCHCFSTVTFEEIWGLPKRIIKLFWEDEGVFMKKKTVANFLQNKKISHMRMRNFIAAKKNRNKIWVKDPVVKDFYPAFSSKHKLFFSNYTFLHLYNYVFTFIRFYIYITTFSHLHVLTFPRFYISRF